MALNETILRRFGELEVRMNNLQPIRSHDGPSYVDTAAWQEWATSVLNLLENTLLASSVHVRNFHAAYDRFSGWAHELDAAKGIFRAAKADYAGGYIFGVEKQLSGEILGDFVALAKAALQDGNKDVAGVLASAALEDALKRYARQNDLAVDDKVMQEVVSALKSKGLVSGAQKQILDTMPKIRDYAMHANWDKLSNADIGSMVGFVEQFLLSHFS